MTESEDRVLTDLLRLAGQHAENIMITLGQDLLPTWAMVDADRRIKIVATPWANEEEKEFHRLSLKMGMLLQDVVAYSFVTEAWAAEVSRQEFENPMGFVNASSHVDRREVVVACAATQEAQKLARWAIERDETGKVTALVPEPVADKNFETWITEMLRW
jgi:hypothetical protein